MRLARIAGFRPRGARLLSLLLVAGFAALNSGCSSTPSSFNSVSLAPSAPQTIGESQSVNITASVLNDASGKGVSWTLGPSGAPGALSNPTATSVTYTAPTSVASATTVTVTGTSVAHANESASLSITIEPKPSVTTTSLPAANEGAAYSATVNGSGGVAPFSWSIASGSLPAGISLGASTTNSVTISGTPTAQGTANFTIQLKDSTGATATQALSIVVGAPLPLAVATKSLPDGGQGAAYGPAQLQATGGLAPFTWTLTSAPSTFPAGLTLAAGGSVSGTPTAAGNYVFTVNVTDSEAPAASAPGTVTLSIGDLSVLKGGYAFEFNGMDSSGASVVAAGSFTSDGAGNITAGVADYNGSKGPANHSFTGTYTIGGDDRGTLSFGVPGSPVYSFAIDPGGLHGRLIEFDSSGTRGSGLLEHQSVSTCGAATINGYYVFGLTGSAEASASTTVGPVALAGAFLATAGTGGVPGSISKGEMDADTPNSPFAFPPSFQTVTGTYGASSNSAACTLALSPSNLLSGSTIDYDAYPISASRYFLVETDSAAAAPYLTAGRLDAQAGAPFTGPGGFSGTSVGAISGQILSGGKYLPDVSIAWLSSSGGGSFQMSAWENSGGNVTTPGVTGGVPSPFSETYSLDSVGRVTSGLQIPFAPVFYVIDATHSVMIGTGQNNPMLGYFEAQSALTFAPGTLKGVFVEGTAPSLVASAPADSGAILLDGVSAVAGLQDQSAPSGNSSAQVVTGSYTGINSTYGSGSYTLTSPASFSGALLIVSPTKLVVISTSGTDANPVLLILGN